METVKLTFVPTSAKLLAGCGELSNTPSVVYDLKHEPLQEVITSDGIDLTGHHWSMRLLGTDDFNENIKRRGGIGTMRMHGSRTCHVEAAVGVAAFELLLRRSSAPETISIHLEGLTYGDYTGIKRVWPKPEQVAIISAVQFSFSQSINQGSDDGEIPSLMSTLIKHAQQNNRLLVLIVVALLFIVVNLYSSRNFL
jgi:hypothetical protein